MLIVLSIILLLAMLIYMTAWFVFGFLYLKRIDSVDSAWGLGFIYVAAIALITFENYNSFALISFGLVTAWGLRLFVHITLRNIKKSEDGRYAVYRQKYANNLNSLVYTKLFLTQGVLILIISSASIAAITADDFNPTFAYIGFAVWVFGILFESVADLQLNRFVKRKTGKIMSSGLWRYSRHPNYFGEITAWTGAGLVAASAGQFWGLIGPAVIAYLIIKVSGLPPIERKYADNKDYQAYAAKTSALIPFPPKH